MWEVSRATRLVILASENYRQMAGNLLWKRIWHAVPGVLSVVFRLGDDLVWFGGRFFCPVCFFRF